jgi:hypothetical protein
VAAIEVFLEGWEKDALLQLKIIRGKIDWSAIFFR